MSAPQARFAPVAAQPAAAQPAGGVARGGSLGPTPTRRTGYSVRAARLRAAPARRRVGGVETLVSTAHKLLLLWRSLWLARRGEARLRRFQERRLREVLADAWANVPLYRELWDAAGVDPGCFRTLDDLRRFPVVEKDAIRDRFPEGCVRRGTRLERCRIQQTSGSSGRCMEIALSLACDDMRNVMSQRVYGWHGFRFWRKAAYLFPYRLPFENNLGIYRNVWIDASQPPERIVDALEAARPVVLAATPSDLLDLLEHLPAGRGLHGIGLRALCLHSEPVSSDERGFFESAFGCPVRINYYCNEIWAIAAECEHGRLHQFMDNVVLELVDECGEPVPDGTPGHVVVTGLGNRVQPFIRYRLGDVAVRRPGAGCPCGRGMPVLERLEGRDDDVFLHPDGRRVHPSKLTVAAKSPCFAWPGLQVFRDYRIVQEAPDGLVLQVVPGREHEPFWECARQGARNLETLLAPGVRVRLQVQDALAEMPGGKRKIFVRALGPDARQKEGGTQC
jgi:phenylacetate-CoA ligase